MLWPKTDEANNPVLDWSAWRGLHGDGGRLAVASWVKARASIPQITVPRRIHAWFLPAGDASARAPGSVVGETEGAETWSKNEGHIISTIGNKQHLKSLKQQSPIHQTGQPQATNTKVTSLRQTRLHAHTSPLRRLLKLNLAFPECGCFHCGKESCVKKTIKAGLRIQVQNSTNLPKSVCMYIYTDVYFSMYIYIYMCTCACFCLFTQLS